MHQKDYHFVLHGARRLLLCYAGADKAIAKTELAAAPPRRASWKSEHIGGLLFTHELPIQVGHPLAGDKMDAD
jgi:hypothetical protein